MPNNKNGVLKLVVYVALGCVTVGSLSYGLGKGTIRDSVDTNTESIKDNTECIRELEQDSAAVRATLTAIKEQLDRIETKVNQIP